MSRQARVKIETGWLHVMNRGLDRLDIYRADGDREHMLELLGEMSERYGVAVHGDRHGDWGRDLAFWLARRATGMTLGQIGKHAGGLDYAAVGMALRYFEARCRRDKKLLRLREKLKNDLLV